MSTRVRKSYDSNSHQNSVFCSWTLVHGQLSQPFILVHGMYTCQGTIVHAINPCSGRCYGHLSIDCLSHVLHIVSGQKCPQDLDLSVNILNVLNYFLGHCIVAANMCLVAEISKFLAFFSTHILTLQQLLEDPV